jgi:TonB-dependent receptor
MIISTRRNAVRLALLASLAATPAFGQIVAAADQAATTNAKAGETTDNDGEIVVVGSRPIAESLAAALTVQKNSDSLVSVLAADSIGRLPDQNIAQAISRLPGLSVQRDQGQARYVNIRGAPLQWTTLSFDGIYVISPEGRDARFDSLPSAIASQVVVNKAVTPDLNGETIAGNVNIVTRSAFDYKGFHVQAKAGAGLNDLGNGPEYEASVVMSNRWETGIGEIGALISGSYYQREMNTENFEIDWETVDQDVRPTGSGDDRNTLLNTGSGPRVWGREIENKFYRLTRKNWALTGRLDWQPDADNRIFLTSIYSIFIDDELRDNFRIDADDQQGRVPSAACTGATPQLPAAGTTGYADVCTGNTPLRGTIYGVDYDARFRQTAYRQSVFTNTLGGDHTLSDAVTLRWRGNYTRSEDDRSQPYLISYQSPGFGTNGATATSRVTARYDFTNPFNSQVQLFNTLRSSTGVLSAGAAVADYASFPNAMTNVTSLDALDVTDAYTGKLELFWNTDLFGDTRFRFGAQYDNRTKTARESQLSISGATGSPLATALAAQSIPNTLAGIAGPTPFAGNIRPGYSFNPFSAARAETIVGEARKLGTFAPVDANFYRVKESVWSGYAMGTTRFDWGNIVYGARVEHVTNSGTAFVFGIGAPRLTTIETSQTLVFPSAHVNWNMSDEHKLRLSFTTGAARPDYTVARPNLTFNDANQTVSGGNPFARPERARGVDLYWEWYGRSGGFASFGVFYKDVSSALFNDTRLYGDTRFDVLPQFERSDYRFSTTVNGGNGYIAGAEAALQMQVDDFGGDHGFIGGFGIIANATYNKSRVTTPDGRRITFPGTSRWVYNVGPYFEKYGVSARVVYQKRTEWLSELGGPDTGGDLFWDTDGELDASIRYAVTPHIEVYAEGGNLLNGPGRRYVGNKVRTLEFEKFGRRFQAGVRVTY